MDSIKLFKNGALVTFDRNKASGFYTVLLRDPSGAVHDKVSCDTRVEALAYRRAFEKIAKNLH